MKYCPYCGDKLEDNMNYCPACGRAFNGSGDNKDIKNDKPKKSVKVPLWIIIDLQ